MQNDNEYNDDAYSQYSVETDMAIQALWEAGATIENIEEVVSNALENAGVLCQVTIQPVGA